MPAVAMIIWQFHNVGTIGFSLGWEFVTVLSWALWVLPLILWLIGESIKSVFKMALYVYATEGVIPVEYREEGSEWFVARKD